MRFRQPISDYGYREVFDIRNLREIFQAIPELSNVIVSVSIDNCTWIKWKTPEEAQVLKNMGIDVNGFTLLTEKEYCDLVEKLWEQYPEVKPENIREKTS